MPNIIGGSQTHPAYMPQKLGEREVLIDNVLWTIKENGSVVWEHVNGDSGHATPPYPKRVQNRIKKLK